MLQGLTTVSLPQIYCRSCHLSTRSDVVRCLHCNRPLETAPAAAKRTVRNTKPVAHALLGAASPLVGTPGGPSGKRTRKIANRAR